MLNRVLLIGSSGQFTGVFRGIVEECGFEAVPADGLSRDAEGLGIFEAECEADLEKVPKKDEARPFLIYTDLAIAHEGALEFKEAGLLGIITGSTSPEDIAFLINKALFYDKMLKRNPRVPVNIPVTLTDGSKVINSSSTLLSRDGMFIVTLNPLPVNHSCLLKFEVPGAGRAMETNVKVLYNITINKDLNIIANPRDPFKRLVAHPGMAVFFTDLPQRDRDLIDRHIETLV